MSDGAAAEETPVDAIRAPTGAGTVGRPRDPRLDGAILDATRELLLEVGYTGITIEAVARRAGVGKPTIYRRWRNKAFLTHDAVYPDIEALDVVWDTGDAVADLRRHVAGMVLLFSQPASVAAAPALLAEFGTHPELRDALWERLEVPARQRFVGMVGAAQERGEVRADLDADTLFHTMVGAVLWQVCALGAHPGTGFETDLCDLLLRGALTS